MLECNDVSHLWNDKAQWPLCTPLRDLWTRSRGPSPRAPKCSSADKLPISSPNPTPCVPPQPLYPSSRASWRSPCTGLFLSRRRSARTKEVRRRPYALLCKWAAWSWIQAAGNLWIFRRNAINNSQPLCGRPYSQVCIYSSLWPQRKFPKWPFQGLGLKKKKKKTASSVSRIPLVSFRWL